MPAQATMIPHKQLIDAAKAPLLAFNDKNWTALKAAITGNFVYDEVATKRKVQGADKAIAAVVVPPGTATRRPRRSRGSVRSESSRTTIEGPYPSPKLAPTGKTT